MLLEKHPQLRPMIEEGRFLLGYTDGRIEGQQMPVFLLRSPWTQFCIWATANDVIPPGGVLVITDDPQWSLESDWKAYSLVNPQTNNKPNKNLTRKGYSRRQNKETSRSSIATLAAEIATKEATKAPSSDREMSSIH